MKNNNFPEKWFIRGCDEFHQYCTKHTANISGDHETYSYFNNSEITDDKYWRDWRFNRFIISEAIDYIELSFDEFKILIEGGSLNTPNTKDDYEPLIHLLKEIKN